MFFGLLSVVLSKEKNFHLSSRWIQQNRFFLLKTIIKDLSKAQIYLEYWIQWLKIKKKSNKHFLHANLQQLIVVNFVNVIRNKQSKIVHHQNERGGSKLLACLKPKKI